MDQRDQAEIDKRAAAFFKRMEEIKHEELRRHYRETTMGERIAEACALSDFGRELHAGLIRARSAR